MKYANEIFGLWVMAMCSYIVLTNPESHTSFIGTVAVFVALYKWMQERENGIRPKD